MNLSYDMYTIFKSEPITLNSILLGTSSLRSFGSHLYSTLSQITAAWSTAHLGSDKQGPLEEGWRIFMMSLIFISILLNETRQWWVEATCQGSNRRTLEPSRGVKSPDQSPVIFLLGSTADAAHFHVQVSNQLFIFLNTSRWNCKPILNQAHTPTYANV